MNDMAVTSRDGFTKLRELLAIAQMESVTDSSKRNTQWIPS
jgi:hypothetical protein